ncbi:MAG: glycosyltransferase family 2 protein [Lachnospiraceae bacterium]|nr:glycosyltransferase family 2 protein [Lachnospiraceae bacterium]
MNKLSIVIPVYYNEDTLMDLYNDLKKKVLHLLDDYEIVMVDDGSKDSSWQIMNQIRQMDSTHVKCVKLSRNFGEHSAILAGLNVCTGDCAVTKQADMQEESELILRMYDSWKNGNKVVLAVREDRDDGKIYQIFAGLYYKLMKKIVNPEMPKGGFDCYLLDRKVIEVIKMLDEKNSALTLQVLWVGFKSEKIYFSRKAREKGKGRWTMGKKIKLVVDSVMSFSYFPVRLMSVTGFIFFLASIVGIIMCISEIVVSGVRTVGWASLMTVLLFSSGVMMLMLGMLGEYVWRALDASSNRPPFLIEDVVSGEDDTSKEE